MQIKTETRVGIFALVALVIFFYMTLQLGFFRFNKENYKLQIVKFDDVAGLEKKAEVKIAGVPVGWVDSIELVSEKNYLAKAHVMILKKYLLHSGASAKVRQESLLGTKYLEILPGNPALPELPSGHELEELAHTVSLDDLLQKVNILASHVINVTDALYATLGQEGKNGLQHTVHSFNQATEKITTLVETLDRTLSTNEDHINHILNDVRDISHNMAGSLPRLCDDISRLTQRMETDFFPSFKSNIERISETFDQDIKHIARQFEHTAGILEEAAVQASDGIKNVNTIISKIDDNKGIMSRLIKKLFFYS